jgi:hypothetical protein
MCTTKEQSEQLLALGLKAETADICIRPDNTLVIIHENSFIYNNLENAMQSEYCPAWSLHRLIEILGVSKMIFNIDLYDSPYEEIIHRIEIFINSGEFNKDYLEE